MRININNRNQIKSLDNKLTLISYLISNGITIPPFEKQGTFINTEGFIKRTTNSFINFQYYATQTLTNLNFYLGTKNQKFSIYKKFNIFKRSRVKFFNIQLSYWLNDFYTGGKESFCQNSLSLVRCSSNHKLQLTNFFSIGFSNLQNSTFFFPTEFNYLNSIAMVFVICCIFFAGTGARRGLLRNFVSNIRNKITQLKNLYFKNTWNSSNKHRGAPLCAVNKKKTVPLCAVNKKKTVPLSAMKKKKLDTVRGYLTVSNFLTVTLIFLLAYFQYRKLALLITGSFLISNSSTVKKYSSGLVEEELRYEKFYKKTFPVLYYTLRPLMLLGSLGFCYSVSAHDINIIESFYRNPMLDLNNLPEIKSLETRVLFFSLIFFPATLLQILISIYIIHHANNNNSKEASMYWNLFKMAGMYVKKVVLPTTAALVGGRLAADIPHVPANEYSNFVHTQTPFGKGYDVEIGSALLKAQADLLQSKVGFDQMLRKVNQYAAETYAAFGGRAGPIITPQVLRDMLVDPEIREVVDRTATYIERQAFGISLVPPGFIQETAESGARYVLDHTIDFRDRKIEEINEYLEWAWEHGKAKWKTEGISIPEVDEDGDIPAEPRPGTPAARATRDQDIRDGRRRNVR